ncbi:glycosyl transferase family 2 [Dokdonia sp. Dokd-P16]|uniref:glycosyltransferase family 2 protein n=1 Tax=Dokdonia sp. Dokd-P16 TaxID=2173169 RepID=UPI000D545EF5|nr:glycosyltransferase family A protein [Dokdonia sp. Dokd-P16]AWH72867.1 glycosyl transferase family 2 [Dokdonia sp. Dokd-P16]
MISLVHHKGIAITGNYNGLPIIEAIYKCARENPDNYLLVYEKTADVDAFKAALPVLNHSAYFFSNYNNSHPDIGYVEDSPFLNINKKVTYPTWLKGTAIVCMHANFINESVLSHSSQKNYLYWLNSLGKLSQTRGVLNYQIPTTIQNEEFETYELYKFVKQHYRTRWVFILLLCHLWYEKRFPVISLMRTIFIKKSLLKIDIHELQTFKKVQTKSNFEYDVIIPTIGRAGYLKDVLEDLAKQTLLAKKVIIVEQNENPNTVTELDYLLIQSWPFEIDHYFIHRTGACNARNNAIAKTSSDWVLLFDDDNRFNNDVLERVSEAIQSTNSKVINLAYLQQGEIENDTYFKQWEAFGSGCSIVHRDIINKCKFDMALEHGYGEDVDYGMQIRNAGYDVIYAPQIQLLHLKAPVGGFRKLHVFPWQEDAVLPKPSPQIMYHRTKNYTPKQLIGYKVTLFIKFYKDYSIKNPIAYYKYFKKAWSKSLYWSQKLAQDATV